jgi:hypothetical protein
MLLRDAGVRANPPHLKNQALPMLHLLTNTLLMGVFFCHGDLYKDE